MKDMTGWVKGKFANVAIEAGRELSPAAGGHRCIGTQELSEGE